MGVLHEVARRGDVGYLKRELVKDKQLERIDEQDSVSILAREGG
jgi:hypothetical protein